MDEQEILTKIEEDIKIVDDDLEKNKKGDKIIVSDYASDKMYELRELIRLYLSDGDENNGIHVCRRKNMELSKLGLEIFLRSFIGDAIYVAVTHDTKFGILLGELSQD